MNARNILHIKDLEKLVGLSFAPGSLLRQALTHSSLINEIHNNSKFSNERMEFLGDSLVGFVMAMELYIRIPEGQEGELSELRSFMVKGETLAKIAKDINLGSFIIMGQGEEHSGGRNRTSNLAATLEALLGAVLLEKGFQEACEVTIDLLKYDLDEVIRNGVQRDSKTLLQEFIQSQGKGNPTYRTIGESGPEHAKIFTVEVLVGETSLGKGDGYRKVDGEREAARKALEYLNPKA